MGATRKLKTALDAGPKHHSLCRTLSHMQVEHFMRGCWDVVAATCMHVSEALPMCGAHEGCALAGGWYV
eukprot:1159732-Pelagomonas_calceolata.AAC.1